jgi:hypothetical protein
VVTAVPMTLKHNRNTARTFRVMHVSGGDLEALAGVEAMNGALC